MILTFHLTSDQVNRFKGDGYYEGPPFVLVVDTTQEVLHLNARRPVFKVPKNTSVGPDDILYFNQRVDGKEYVLPVADVVVAFPYPEVVRAAMSEHSKVLIQWNTRRAKAIVKKTRKAFGHADN